MKDNIIYLKDIGTQGLKKVPEKQAKPKKRLSKQEKIKNRVEQLIKAELPLQDVMETILNEFIQDQDIKI